MSRPSEGSGHWSQSTFGSFQSAARLTELTPSSGVMVLDRRGEDLEERMLDFAARVGKVVDAIPETRLGRHIAGQLVRSGTSPAPKGNQQEPKQL